MMQLKFLVDEDLVNYKQCSMFLGFPYCTFKCDKENHSKLCQNAFLADQATVAVTPSAIYARYIDNPLTKAVVLGGLEPFDSFEDVISLISYFRDKKCFDPFVIYTGYTEDEIVNNPAYKDIFTYSNLIIKYGRFKPNQKSRYDEVLGVTLVSDNQYAKHYN